MAEPKVNDRFVKNGFKFRVDKVGDDQVYYCRWPISAVTEDEHIDTGSLGRVSIALWSDSMHDAEKIP